MARKSRATGARSISSNFRRITPGLTVPMNFASRKALAPMLRQAKANLLANGNVDSGELLKLLTIKKDPSAGRNTSRHLVGPATTSPGYRKAHLIEFGTRPHKLGRAGGEHPGSRAFPFLTPAFEATKNLVVEIFGREIGPAIEKRAAQLAKKGKK